MGCSLRGPPARLVVGGWKARGEDGRGRVLILRQRPSGGPQNTFRMSKRGGLFTANKPRVKEIGDLGHPSNRGWGTGKWLGPSAGMKQMDGG